MSWADVPGWGALGVSAVALGISIRALKHSDRAAAAAERSAAAEEAALADQRAAAAPKVELVLEPPGGGRKWGVFQLRNIGELTATAVTVLEEGYPATSERPVGVTLEPGEAHTFLLSPGINEPLPAQLKVVWDGQSDPVAIRIP
ncbi:hypothetical protein ACFYO0_14465 [Streptomyces sp. NPDC006365]|uniref:hypothetical protein n=1 Tax=Streptomyces sp. NPDC006365 TaxID=3364744 RepID=UPI0036828D65